MNDRVSLAHRDAIEFAAQRHREQVAQWKAQFQWDLVRSNGRLERVCDHGCGHTVGHVKGFLTEVDSIHGCCGCCRNWPRMAFRPF